MLFIIMDGSSRPQQGWAMRQADAIIANHIVIIKPGK